jgi:TetR/AcrR family transcriptional regulator, fatty acid biosynthesis regulator
MASREEIIAQKEKTTLSLMEAALELCAEEGFASLSLRSVARKAGIAPTSFYRHFRDIDELGISMVMEAKKIMDECLGEVRRGIQLSSLKASNSVKDLLRMVDNFIRPFAPICFQYFEKYNYLLRLFFQERTGSSSAMRTAISTEMDQLIDFLSEDLEKLSHACGKPLGDIRLVAETMLTIIMSSGMEIMVAPEKSDHEIISQSMQDKLALLLAGALISHEAETDSKTALKMTTDHIQMKKLQ